MFLGRNIYRQLFCRKLPERNELFLPGRMAYVVDLEDDFTESDVPTTLIRSKADCPSLEVCDLLYVPSVSWTFYRVSKNTALHNGCTTVQFISAFSAV